MAVWSIYMAVWSMTYVLRQQIDYIITMVVGWTTCMCIRIRKGWCDESLIVCVLYKTIRDELILGGLTLCVYNVNGVYVGGSLHYLVFSCYTADSTLSHFPSLSLSLLFRIITSYRTFFLYASSAQEAEDWIKILRWRLVCLITHNHCIYLSFFSIPPPHSYRPPSLTLFIFPGASTRYWELIWTAEILLCLIIHVHVYIHYWTQSDNSRMYTIHAQYGGMMYYARWADTRGG